MLVRIRGAVLATAALWCVLSVPAASADGPGRRLSRLSRELVWSMGEMPVLAVLPEDRLRADGATFDGELFAQELFAFGIKEAFADAEDEYAGSSHIPARLSDGLPDERNLFGEHCLHVANRLRLGLAGALRLEGLGRSSVALVGREGDVPAVLAAGLALHGLWRGLRNEIVDRRDGVSLRPKISRRTLALRVTFRW